MSTRDTLKAMSDDELYTWFCENAQAHELINDTTRYSIRIGASSSCIIADDPDELFRKLKLALRRRVTFNEVSKLP